jgi:hypothetical protein
VFINFTEVSVDLEGKTWVDMDAKVDDKRTLESVMVRVEKEGVILTLPSKERAVPVKYAPRRLYIGTYAPVIQIIEEPDDPYLVFGRSGKSTKS